MVSLALLLLGSRFKAITCVQTLSGKTEPSWGRVRAGQHRELYRKSARSSRALEQPLAGPRPRLRGTLFWLLRPPA